MSHDHRNQFQLDGQLSTLSIKPRVAPTKFVEYTGSQHLPLLDSPKFETIFDLEPEEIPATISLQFVTIWFGLLAMCIAY